MPAQLFVIEHRPGPTWQAGTPYPEQPGIGDHIAFMRSLADRGLLVLGGPFVEEVDGTAVGMAVVDVPSREEAETLAAEDASVQAGLIRYRVRPWRAVMGSAADLA